MMLLDHPEINDFYTKIALFGLQSNEDKTNNGIVVRLTERCMTIIKTKIGDKEVYKFITSRLPPLKMLTTMTSYVMGRDPAFSIKSNQFTI